MIIYKYVEEMFTPNPEDEKFCKEHNIVYFKQSKEREVWLKNWLREFKTPKIESETNTVCYWGSLGTWGMYHPEDNSTSICPYRIEEAPGGLEGVIRHEIQHLKQTD